MIILDTHCWVWWVSEVDRLTDRQHRIISQQQEEGVVSVSAISAWEIAKLVERGRLRLDRDVSVWIEQALEGIRLIELSSEIAVASARLPGRSHSDPADQIIVATALTYDCDLVTSDQKIIDYEHVRTVN